VAKSAGYTLLLGSTLNFSYRFQPTYYTAVV